jgi:integrase
MACLWKHPQSKNWFARFTDSSGRRRNRSTGTPNRKEAVKIAESYESAGKTMRTAKQVRKVIAELHQQISGEMLVTQSFKIFAASWLAKKDGEVSPATLNFYKKTVSKFSKFLGPKADEDMASITAAHVLSFRSSLAKSISAKTTNHNIKGLRMIFKAARQEQVIADNPTESVNTLKVTDRTERRPFTLDEVRKLLTHADQEWKSMIRFGLYTGQRLADLAMLTWGKINIPQAEIRLRTRKTGKPLIIPIAPPLLDALKAQPKPADPDAPVHPNAFKTLSRNGMSATLSNQFSDILAKAGLRSKAPRRRKENGKGRATAREVSQLSFHCFRHTAVTLLKEAGISAAVVMEMIGHDSEQMSAHYTHVGKEAMEKAAKTLPRL